MTDNVVSVVWASNIGVCLCVVLVVPPNQNHGLVGKFYINWYHLREVFSYQGDGINMIYRYRGQVACGLLCLDFGCPGSCCLPWEEMSSFQEEKSWKIHGKIVENHEVWTSPKDI